MQERCSSNLVLEYDVVGSFPITLGITKFQLKASLWLSSVNIY